MRVIAGKARRLLLKTIEGMDTRPTTDRIKETLFNILNPELPDSVFLDLFSGSGAIGIEAVSRGAKQAVFVEQNPAAVSCIRDNLSSTRLEETAVVMSCDVMTALTRLEERGYVFDFIFMDPPYDMGWEEKVLEFLRTSRLAGDHTVIIVEASLSTELSYADSMGFRVYRTKRYKTNQHFFLYRKER